MIVRAMIFAAAISSVMGVAHAAMTKAGVIACKEPAALIAIAKLRAGKGKAASVDFEAAKLANGECTTILIDTSITIDERKGPLFCVRPPGGLDCYWATAAGIDEYAKPRAAGTSGPFLGNDKGSR